MLCVVGSRGEKRVVTSCKALIAVGCIWLSDASTWGLPRACLTVRTWRFWSWWDDLYSTWVEDFCSTIPTQKRLKKNKEEKKGFWLWRKINSNMMISVCSKLFWKVLLSNPLNGKFLHCDAAARLCRWFLLFFQTSTTQFDNLSCINAKDAPKLPYFIFLFQSSSKDYMFMYWLAHHQRPSL